MQKISWNELVKLALLGTDRSQLSETHLEALKQLGVDSSQQPAHILLEAAALLGPMQKAGQQFSTWTAPLPQPAVEKDALDCSPRSAYHLAQILAKEKEVLLQDFLQLLAEKGRCLPAEQLPTLLQRALTAPNFWQQIRPILGPKGHWLIQQHPEWRQLIESPPLTLWENGKKEQRLQLLSSLRLKTPEKGLELLRESWSTETPANKAKFLARLQDGLSQQDEAFLEDCLDEGRKEVRREAAKLLRQLPDSQLVKRMQERVRQLITFTQTKNKKIKLDVQPPEGFDDELVRDGLDIKLRWPKGGVKASRLWQITSAIPLQFWCDYLGLNAKEILDLFAKNDWRELLVQALVDACQLHPNEEWRELLLQFWIKHHTEPRWFDLKVQPLLDSLPGTLPDAILLAPLKHAKEGIDAEHPLSLILQLPSKQWSQDLSMLVAKQLQKWIAAEGYGYTVNYHYRNILKNAAFATNPLLFKALKISWDGVSRQYPAWEQDIQDFLAMLGFRRRMYEEMEEEIN